MEYAPLLIMQHEDLTASEFANPAGQELHAQTTPRATAAAAILSKLDMAVPDIINSLLSAEPFAAVCPHQRLHSRREWSSYWHKRQRYRFQ